MNKIIKYNNSLSVSNGARLLTKFYNACLSNDYSIDKRTCYHIGLKSILYPESEDSIVIDGTLIMAEGLSPRWLLMR